MSIFINNKYTTWYFNIINKAQVENRQKYQGMYYESHHILPKSLKGSDEITNLVLLTAREHFICHLLLPDMLTGINKRNMSFAIWSMIYGHNKWHERYTPSSRLYEVAKKKVARASSELHTGKIVSKETRIKMSKSAKGRLSPFKGKTHTTESKLKNSESSKGQIPWNKGKEHQWGSHTEEAKYKISESNKRSHQMNPRIHTEETKQRISQTMKGRSNFWLKGKPAHNKGKTHSEETKEKQRLQASKRIKTECQHCLNSYTPGNYGMWHGDKCKQR